MTSFTKTLPLQFLRLIWATGLVFAGITFSGQAYADTATASPTLCVNDASIGVATGNWTGQTNVGTQNDVYAQASVANSNITNYLKCTGYGFSIPAGATINGITVGPWLNSSFTMYDNAIQLVKGGAIQATNLATGASIPNGGGAFAAAPTQFTYGSSTNLWGNTWTAVDINSANFGAVFAAQRGGFASTQQVGVDAMPITVDYTPSAGGGGGGVSGGCSTSAVGSDTVVTCTGDGSITIPSGVTSVRYLVVGGGGGGGGNTGGWGSGAGGAGGVLKGTSFAVTGGATYTVTVGAEGSGGTGNVSLGGNGGNSTFSTLTAIGGGGGASQGVSNDGTNGGSGGSGRGNGSGGTGTAGQGNNGGDGSASGSSAGGGGGAGAAGVSATDRNGGNGGIGVSDNITGAAITYGAGGTGGGRDSGYSGGNGAAGTANSGNGGDGTPGRGGTTTGGAGGSGVVIIRYAPATVSVLSINLASSNPTNPATLVSWTVTFSASVTGVDATDFALVQAGGVSGATITSVTGSGITWTVNANTGSGYGSLGLNLVDDDSIVDGGGKKLGGTGVGNGNFTGQVYSIPAPPTVSSINRASSNPTIPATSVSWAVIFSASVSGVDAADFTLVQAGGASGASISSVIGSGTTWTVTADTGSGIGTLGLNLVDNDSIIDGSGTPLGGTGAGNGNFAGQVYTINAEPVLAEYRMDAASWNGTANEVLDSSGNGNNASSYNSANTEGITPANVGTCRYGVFDNGSTITSGYIQTPLPNLTTDFTVSAWIRTTNNLPSGQRILIDDQNNTGGYGISLGDGAPGRIRFYSRGISPVILDSTYTIANNTWYFVAAVADISNRIRTIYVFNSAGALLNSTSDASAFTGTWGTDVGPVSIGGETNASGEATASFHFHGNLDEVRVYQKALNQSALAAIAAQTHACIIGGGPDHFAIVHDGSGVNCQSEPVTISAHATDHSVDSGYTGTLNLSTSTGHGDWTVISGLGALNNGAADDGVATYNMVAGDNGVVVLGLKDPHVETLNINANDGVASETTGAALASEDQSLAFAQSGFVFLANGMADNIGTQIAGKSSAVLPGAQLIELQAIRTSDSTGACEAALQGVNAIEMAFECRNPSSCSAIPVNINGGVSTNIPGNPMGAIGSYIPVNLDFGNATDSTASFVLNYADAGQIQLHARYNIPLDDGTGTPSSIYINGGSNAFVVRPFGFELDFSGDRAANGITGASYAADANGSIFQLAGNAFNTSLTAVAWSSVDDTNNDGVPDACANLTDNSVTANFGNEMAAVIPASVTLGNSLVEPSAGGVPGSLTTTANSATFAAGVGSKTIAWSEVGIMNLNVSRADYLGSGQAVQGNVCNVGRFYPKDFVIANATVTNRSDIALCASPFTYMDENFTIDFDLQVYNAATPPALTQNYIGAFAKLDPTALGNMNYGATDSGTNYTARLGVSSAGAFTAGVAPVTATLVLAKNAVPDGLYANMAIGIAPADGDGVSLRSLDLSLNGGASSHGKLGQTDIRYGRLNLQNNFGSELLALTLPLSTEYYQATAAEFVTNVDDSCTTRTPANVLLYNDQEAKAGRAVGNPVININGGNSTTLTGITPFVAGQAALTFTAPGVEGYVDVEVQTPSWLQSNIDGIDQGLQGPGMHCNPALAVSDPAYIAGCIADGNSIDETPLSRGNFGIFKGSNNIIYMRETY